MIIDKLEIEGFKSYKTKTVLKDFDNNFNAITGENGSGKSNILDSICFVLGLSYTELIRISKIQELIYFDGISKLNDAKITLRLKSPKFGKKLTIARQIFKNGKNRYFFDGLKVSPSKILNFLYSINLNINNPHFLIRQGHISNVIFMSQFELFELFENAIGTKLYETKKKMANEIIKQKKDQLMQINLILNEKIKPLIENFELFTKKIQKKEFYKNKKNEYEFVKIQLDTILLKKEGNEIINKRINCSKKKLIESIDHTQNVRLKGMNIQKKNLTKIKLDEILKGFNLRKILFFNLERLLSSFNFVFKFLKFNHSKKQTKEDSLFRKRKEKKYLNKFFFFNNNFHNKWFFDEIKKKKKKIFKLNENFWLLFGSKLYKSLYKKKISFVSTFKKKFCKIKNELKNLIFIDNFQTIPRFYSKKPLEKFFTCKIRFKKNIIKENLTNYFFLVGKSLWNFKNSWYFRKVVIGNLIGLIHLKSPNLINPYEHSLFCKSDPVLIEYKFIKNEYKKNIRQMYQSNIVLKKKDHMWLQYEKFNRQTLKLISFFNFKTVLCEIVNWYTKLFVLINLDNLGKVLRHCLTVGYNLATFYGEIFESRVELYYYGSFRKNINSLFEKIRLNSYVFQWIKFGSLVKKGFLLKQICPLNAFWIGNLKNSRKMYMIYVLKQIYLALTFKDKIFLESKKNKSVIEKFFFLRKLNLYNWKKKEFSIRSTIIQEKLSLKLFSTIFEKVRFYFKTMEFEMERIQKNFLYFYSYSLEFFFRIFLINRKIHKVYSFLDFKNKYKKINLIGGTTLKNLKFFHRNRLKSIKKNIFLFIYGLENNLNFNLLAIRKFSEMSNFSYISSQHFEYASNFSYFEKISIKYDEFLFKRIKIEKDRLNILEIILQLDKKKSKLINSAIKKINSSFGTIFKGMILIYNAEILLTKNKEKKWVGIKFRIFNNQIEKYPNELSGGQKSILALSFIFALLIFKTAPFYIFDEIDAALDFCHTKNLSNLIFQNFPFAQFIVISLKKQIVSNAQVIFEIKRVCGKSCVVRLEKLPYV